MKQAQWGESAEATQLRRMREVWASTRPTTQEIRRAYLRWSLRRGHRTHGRARSLSLLAVAALFVAGGALGVTGVLRRPIPLDSSGESKVSPMPSGRTSLGGSSRRSAEPPPTHQSTAAPKNDSGQHDPSAPEAAVTPETLPPVRAVSSSRLADPAAVPVPRAPTPRMIRPLAAPLPTIEAAAPPPQAPDPGYWSRVAQAMREGDPQRVDAELEALSQSNDTETRDAARLARAQLAIANGESDGTHVELQELAVTGATPMVRRRAKDMLRRLSK